MGNFADRATSVKARTDLCAVGQAMVDTITDQQDEEALRRLASERQWVAIAQLLGLTKGNAGSAVKRHLQTGMCKCADGVAYEGICRG